ncbi:hypothetical protein RBB78_17405 [Tunturiibacter empetritectus]
MGVGEAAAAGEEEAEGEMGVEVGGVGGDGAAVGGFGGGGLVECVLGEGEVVEEVGVGGGFFSEVGEELEGGGIVLLVEGFVGLGAGGVDRCGFGSGGGVDGACRELCVDGPGGERRGRKINMSEQRR